MGTLVAPERSVLRTQASQNAQNSARTRPNKKGKNAAKKRAGGFGGAAAPLRGPGGESRKNLPGNPPSISSWLLVFQNAAGTQPERWNLERVFQGD